MKIRLSEIKKNKVIDINIDIDNFNNEYHSSFIKKFNSIEGKIKIQKINDIYILDFNILANLTLISSLSLKEFDDDYEFSDKLYFTTNKELESEDTFLVKDIVDLDNIIYTLIVSSLPISIHAPNEEVIESDEYRVISEDDLDSENTSPFDVLKNLDL